MSLFFALLLLSLCLLFIGRGFLQSVPMTLDYERQQEQRRLAGKRLAELQRLQDQELLSSHEFAQHEAELARPLLQEYVDGGRSLALGSRRAPWPLAVVLMLALSLASFYSYHRLGALEGLQLSQALQSMPPQGLSEPQERKLLTLWQSWLVKQPRDVDGWYVVGRSYLGLGDFAAAEQAFLNSLLALGRFDSPRPEDQARLYASLAQTRFLADNRLDAQAQDYLDRALALNSDDRVANVLAAIASFANADYLQTLRSLQGILGSSEDPVEQASMQALAAEAERRFLAEGGSQVQLDALAGTGFVVSIDGLSSIIRQEFPVIFVTASVPGSRLPIAVRRVSMAELPIQVLLTDQHLMSATQDFDSVEQLELRARFSRTGSATVSDQDWVSPPVLVDRPSGLLPVSLYVDRPFAP